MSRFSSRLSSLLLSSRNILSKQKFRKLRQKIVSGWGLAARDDMRRTVERLDQIEQQLRQRDRATTKPQFDLAVESLQQVAREHGDALRWLGENHHSVFADRISSPLSDQNAETTSGRSLISIVMPVRNREASIAAAIESVRQQTWLAWELLIVDDFCTDGTDEIVRQYSDDLRIRWMPNTGRGVSAARNTALHVAKGEIVAYLDSDNTWFPGFLERVVEIFRDQPNVECAYAAQLVESQERRQSFIRGVEFHRERYLKEGGIDLNAFVHRTSLFHRCGGFDEAMTRLVDWDLIARYTEQTDPTPIPTIAGRYQEKTPDSVSARESFWRNRYLMQRKFDRPVERSPRVLYVLWDYPQLTETYVRWEIACLRRWGVEIEVWSELENPVAQYPSEVPVHNGPLADVIRKFRPHVVHCHWLHFVPKYRDTVARFGLPMTVRGHGFEFNPQLLQTLATDPVVRKLYVFPHYADRIPELPKVRPTPVGFNGDLYYPEKEKDRFLVVRASAAKPAKHLEDFVDIARQCPEHRFVLALGRINNLASYVDEFLEYNRRHGSPVDVRIDLPTEEVAALVRSAGIYLHTYGHEEPFGMPISIAEAMATGCYTLVPQVPGAESYVGQAGYLYGSVKEAASHIWYSASWPRGLWDDIHRRAVDWSYSQYADVNVFRPMFDDWLAQSEFQAGVSPVDICDDPGLQLLLDVHIAEGASDRAVFRDNTRLAHCLGTYRYLRSWGCDLDICRAGLFHNMYTPPGRQFPISARDHMKTLIGERAEFLAYCRCAFQYGDATAAFPEFQAALKTTSGPIQIHDRFTGHKLELSQEQFQDLCWVVLADWVEKSPRGKEWEKSEVYTEISLRLNAAARASIERICGPSASNSGRATLPSHRFLSELPLRLKAG